MRSVLVGIVVKLGEFGLAAALAASVGCSIRAGSDGAADQGTEEVGHRHK